MRAATPRSLIRNINGTMERNTLWHFCNHEPVAKHLLTLIQPDLVSLYTILLDTSDFYFN
jgi:hypothetical protein